MGTSHSHHHNASNASDGNIGDESNVSSSGGGGGGGNKRRNSRSKIFARFGHRKSKDQLLSPSSIEGGGSFLADVDEAGSEVNENADNQLGNCDIVVLKETSSSSDSLFTDPLTPIGFQAEINQCYFSEENICEKSLDERTLRELTAAALAARNYPRQNNKCERPPRRRGATTATYYRDVAARLARLSQTKVTHLNLTGGRPISIDFESDCADEEMALQLGNKLAQVLSNSGGSGSSSGAGGGSGSGIMGADDSGNAGGGGRSSADLGIFNIAKAKKIELQNLSSRIAGGDVAVSADNLTPATIVNKQSPSTETQSTVIISYKSPPPTPICSSTANSSTFQQQHQNVETQRDGVVSASASASTLTSNVASSSGGGGGWVETASPIITSTTTTPSSSTFGSSISNPNNCAGSNVLKKVASFTVERSSQNTCSAGGNLGAPGGVAIGMAPDGGFHKRMSYVPQKLSFAAYEKFEGQMLMKWLISSFQANGPSLNEHELNILTQQYCNNLLRVGVLKQISSSSPIVSSGSTSSLAVVPGGSSSVVTTPTTTTTNAAAAAVNAATTLSAAAASSAVDKSELETFSENC